MVPTTVGTVAFCSRDACAYWAGRFVTAGTSSLAFACSGWMAQFVTIFALDDVLVYMCSDWV